MNTAKGTNEEDPQWLQSDIAEHLLETQNEDGSWKGQCGVVPDTSFSVLFSPAFDEEGFD